MAQPQQPIAAAIARIIRRRRDDRGWSAQELADRCGPPFTRELIANIESGRRKDVSVDQAAALADVFGITLLELLADATDHAAPPLTFADLPGSLQLSDLGDATPADLDRRSTWVYIAGDLAQRLHDLQHHREQDPR